MGVALKKFNSCASCTREKSRARLELQQNEILHEDVCPEHANWSVLVVNGYRDLAIGLEAEPGRFSRDCSFIHTLGEATT